MTARRAWEDPAELVVGMLALCLILPWPSVAGQAIHSNVPPLAGTPSGGASDLVTNAPNQSIRTTWSQTALHDPSAPISAHPSIQVIANISTGPAPLALSYDGLNGEIYVANSGWNNISVLNGSRGTEDGSITVGWGPTDLSVDSATGHLWVANQIDDNLSAVDLTANSVPLSVTVGRSPWGVDAPGDLGEVWATNYGSDNLSRVNSTSGRVVGTLPTGAGPGLMAYDPVRDRFFVSNSGSNNVTVYDARTDRSIASIPTGAYPLAIAIDPVRDLGAVANWNSNNVTFFDTSTLRVLGTMATGKEPYGVAADPAGGRLFVTSYGSDRLTVVDESTRASTANISVGGGPTGIAYDAYSQMLFVADTNASEVTVLNAFDPVGTIEVYEYGLPSGTAWNLTASSPAGGTKNWSSTNSSLLVQLEMNQTYTLTPSAGGFVAFPANVTVGVTESVKRLTFHFGVYRTYPVWFNETGLASGTSWNVTGDFAGCVSTGQSCETSLPNSTTYSFVVSAGAGYRPHPGNGSFAVNGGSVAVSIVFSALTSASVTLWYNETGLPTGDRWGVLLDETSPSVSSTANSSTGATVSFLVEPAFRGNFSVPNVGGYVPTPSFGTVDTEPESAVVTTSITFHAPPEHALFSNFSLRYDRESCASNGGVTNLVSLTAIAAGGTPPYSYRWSLPTGPATGIEANTTLTYGGNNTIGLSVVDRNGTEYSLSQIPGVLLPPCPPPANSRGSTPPPSSSDIYWDLGFVGAVVVLSAGGFWILRGRRSTGGAPPERGS